MPPVFLEKVRSCLLDIEQPVAQRTHAAFHLRTRGDEDCAAIIREALSNKADGALMRHELAYILGQMQHRSSIPLLSSILCDESDDVLVRHESAEALGAIGAEESLEVLKSFCSHHAPEIAETCQIAVDLIAWRSTHPEAPRCTGGYLSVDPAPSLQQETPDTEVEVLRERLLDPLVSLFQRYRAMFSLRDINTNASALALVDGFKDPSALFRHEVAYVLGQMQREVTVPGLSKVLSDLSEHRMVRHEAAEALGAIGGAEVEALLQSFVGDGEIVVEESCHVALDTIEYWSASDFGEQQS